MSEWPKVFEQRYSSGLVIRIAFLSREHTCRSVIVSGGNIGEQSGVERTFYEVFDGPDWYEVHPDAELATLRAKMAIAKLDIEIALQSLRNRPSVSSATEQELLASAIRSLTVTIPRVSDSPLEAWTTPQLWMQVAFMKMANGMGEASAAFEAARLSRDEALAVVRGAVDLIYETTGNHGG